MIKGDNFLHYTKVIYPLIILNLYNLILLTSFVNISAILFEYTSCKCILLLWIDDQV